MADGVVDRLGEDLSVEALERDPYPIYARLRREAPVVWAPGLRGWLVTRWEDVKAGHGDASAFETGTREESERVFGGRNILSVDGDEHKRYRSSLDPVLKPRPVEGYADDLLGPIVERQLDLVEGLGSGEMMASFFEPISVLALGAVLGLPDLDPDVLRRWFHSLNTGITNLGGEEARQAHGLAISSEIDEVLLPEMRRMEREPDGSLISHMLAHAVGETFEERAADMMPSIKVIILGALQEPGHGAASTTVGILSDEATRARFLEAPADLAAAAVEEGLRWIAPIGVDGRRTLNDIELSGVVVPAGASLLLAQGSANRDEEHWGADAEEFRLDRSTQSHLAFGFGAHFCAGAFLSRRLMRLTVRRLFERLPALRLDPEDPPVFHGFVFRGPQRLPAVWR